MSELSSRVQANMDVVLEQVCAELPHGGDHESRKYIAGQLIEAADAGRVTLGELTAVASRALIDLTNRPKSAQSKGCLHGRRPLYDGYSRTCIWAGPTDKRCATCLGCRDDPGGFRPASRIGADPAARADLASLSSIGPRFASAASHTYRSREGRARPSRSRI